MTMIFNSNVKNGQIWIHSDIMYRIQSILDTNCSLRISDFLNRNPEFLSARKLKPFGVALKDFNELRTACFGQDLDSNFKAKILKFKASFAKLPIEVFPRSILSLITLKTFVMIMGLLVPMPNRVLSLYTMHLQNCGRQVTKETWKTIVILESYLMQWYNLRANELFFVIFSQCVIVSKFRMCILMK